MRAGHTCGFRSMPDLNDVVELSQKEVDLHIPLPTSRELDMLAGGETSRTRSLGAAAAYQAHLDVLHSIESLEEDDWLPKQGEID